MKFTQQNQKWVLTLGLLVALGFNLSVHFSPKSGPDYAQLGASQEQIEPVMLAHNRVEGVTHLSQESAPAKKIEDAKPAQAVEGTKPVPAKEEAKPSPAKTEANIDESLSVSTDRYGSGNNNIVVFTKSADGKTLATHPKCKSQIKETDCVTCSKVHTTLNVEFTKDLAVLNKALSAIDGCGTDEKEKKSDDEIAKEKHKDDLKKLAKECDKKSKTDRLECSIDGLTKLLKENKITYEKSDVTSFFDKYIKEPLRVELDSANIFNTNWTLGGFSEYREKLYNLTGKIKEMQDEIPGEYSYLRDRLVNISVRAIADKALEINNYRHSNSPDAMIAENISMGQLQLMSQLLPTSNKAGLLSAVGNGFIDQRYAMNLYNSVGNYGNLVLNNLSDITNMSPFAADRMLNFGLMGIDSWDYKRSAINSLDLGYRYRGFNDERAFAISGRFDDYDLFDRSDRYDRGFRRGFFSDSYSDRLGRRYSSGRFSLDDRLDRRYSLGDSRLEDPRSLRGTGSFRSGSSIFGSRFSNNNSRLGILGSRNLRFDNQLGRGTRTRSILSDY